MQRRADIYENPLEFIPERFSNMEKMESRNAFNWLAFSAGPRNCIGNLALQIVQILSRDRGTVFPYTTLLVRESRRNK